MALRRDIICDTCQQKKEVWFSGQLPPKTCGGCIAKAEAAKLQEHLAVLAELPTEERIRKIEEWIYHHSRNHPRNETRY